VHTTHIWNNFHEVRQTSKDWKVLGTGIPKSLNRKNA